MADEHPPPEDVERAGELARERGWKDIGGQGVVSDPAKTLHVPSSIDTFNPAGEPTAYPASEPKDDPAGYIELDERGNCPHGSHKGLGCRVCDPVVSETV